MNKKSKINDLGVIKITSVKDNPDGTCTMDFEIDDKFVAWFKKETGAKRFSKKKFNKFIVETLEKAVSRKDGWALESSKSFNEELNDSLESNN